MIILRFRDITVPDAETINRHAAISEKHGKVWWGWMMRQHEAFPADFLLSLSAELTKSSQKVLLLHTGFRKLYDAKLHRVATFPDGKKITSPERNFTPTYMHESECAAWFSLSSFAEAEMTSIPNISALPTLPNPSQSDSLLLSEVDIPLEKLSSSDATIWETP